MYYLLYCVYCLLVYYYNIYRNLFLEEFRSDVYYEKSRT